MSARVQQFDTCSRCGLRVALRDDGRPGRHWAVRGRNRTRCPEGEQPTAPPKARRRVRVVIDVLVPVDTPAGEYRRLAAAVLREHALSLDVFIVDVDTAEAS